MRGALKYPLYVNGDNFAAATQAGSNGKPRSDLVTNIANFVEQHNLDGVDINWEYPGLDANGDPKTPQPQTQIAEWNNCIALLNDLKDHPKLNLHYSQNFRICIIYTCAACTVPSTRARSASRFFQYLYVRY